MQYRKKNYRHLVPITLALSFFTSGCTLSRMVRQARHQEISVQPTPLAASGTDVTFELKATVPEKLIKDKHRYKLEVYYEYGEQQREDLGALNFEFGEFIYENGKPTITKVFAFPYEPKKDQGRLMVQGLAIDKRDDDVKYTEPQQVASGLLTTPLLMVRNNEVVYVPDKYAEEAAGPAVLSFYFEENQARLRHYIGSNLQALDQYTLDNVGTQKLTIIAGQSPDETGSGLARKRAKVLEDYYRSKVKTLDYSGKKIEVQTRVQEQNWDLLLQKVKASALPKAQVQEVTDLLESRKTDKEKQKALEKTEAYSYLEQYVYPSMRYADVEINYNRTRKSDYQLFLLARKIADETADADILTEEELQHAATLTPLLAEKQKLYEAAVKTTDKWPAYHNLGKVYIEMARKDYRPKAKKALLARAIHNLTYAGFRNPTAEVYYSLASAYHVRGDKLEALQYYDYAIKLGGSKELLQRIFADKAALEIEIAQYDDAIESLRYAGDSYQTNMNLGLSYLLKENYEGAVGFYHRALEQQPGDALAHYSLAIVGARTQNEQMLTEHLRKAVQADKTFTRKAIEDKEFDAFRRKPAYEEALIR